MSVMHFILLQVLVLLSSTKQYTFPSEWEYNVLAIVILSYSNICYECWHLNSTAVGEENICLSICLFYVLERS